MSFRALLLRAGPLLVPLLSLSFGDAQATVDRGRVLVLRSKGALPSEEVLAGFQQHLSSKGIQVDLDVHSLEEGKDLGDVAGNGNAPLLVLALGSQAAQTAMEKLSDLPIVTGLVLKGDDIHKSGAAGVVLEFPLEIQFQWMHRMIPGAKRIGVLYNPEENQKIITAAEKIAERQGLELIARPVSSPQELPRALESLAQDVDVLWGVPDRLVLSTQTAKNILLFSFRNRIPFVGLSPPWVKAGALFSLHWDFEDLGIQCGELAVRAIRGAPLTGLRPATPRTVLYSVNLKTARHMKLKIAESLTSGAAKVYN